MSQEFAGKSRTCVSGALAVARVSVIAGLIAAGVAGPAASAIDPSCKPATDAMMKQLATPTHAFVTEAAPGGGRPEVKETIYAGGAIYVQMKGIWRRSPMSVQQMREQQEENQRNAKSMTCRYLRDETVHGEAAAVYRAQADVEGIKSDATLWVSKRTGLPLRSENDLDTGDKTKRHLSIRYDYADVRPPAGVR
jgi:hypothetical protein